MYIEINGTQYRNVQRTHTHNTITYTGEALAEISAIDGKIDVYANDDFLLRTDDPAAFLRTVITDGKIQLTNLPENYVPPLTTEERVSTLESTMDVLLGVVE